MTQTGPTLGAPTWAGDWLDRNSLVPGGAKVNPADFAAGSDGAKRIPGGTVLGRTIAERDAGQGYGPAADTDPASEIFILALDVTDALDISDCELYRPGKIVKENFLPDWATLTATIKAALRAKYVLTRGAE